MTAPHVDLGPAELACLEEGAGSDGEFGPGPEGLAVGESRAAPDRPLAGRREVSAAQNVRHQAPLFVALDGLELMKLRRFPAWVRWLFLEMCAACDFETGELATSYAKLQALLECDQPRQGGRRLPVPSVPQIRRALDDLEAASMLGRDKAYNVKANGGRGILFLSVGPRKSFGSAKANRDRGCDRVEKERKRRRHRVSKASGTGVATGVAAGVSGAEITNTPTPNSADLSTSQSARTASAGPHSVAQIVGAAVGQKLGPPRGANNCPPGAGTPPRSWYAQKLLAASVDEKIDPPGGQDDAPQGAAKGLLPSSRIRRPSNAV